MGKTTRSIRVTVTLQQKDAGTYSGSNLMSQEITIPANLPQGKVLAVVGNLIDGIVNTVEIVHGPLPVETDEEIVGTSSL